MSSTWIQTHSGLELDLLDPKPELLEIRDIARGLSHACRFAGQCRTFYSVAQHSVNVSRWVGQYRPALALAALLHDASEAYLMDLVMPLKHLTLLGDEYKRIEDKMMRAVAERFVAPGLYPLDPFIKKADHVVLACEAPFLMAPYYRRERWTLLTQERDPLFNIGEPLLPDAAMDEFFNRFWFLDDGVSDSEWIKHHRRPNA